VRITRLETFILHVPVTGGGIADGSHQVGSLGRPGRASTPTPAWSAPATPAPTPTWRATA
jgi:hypothetical protein